MTIAAAALGAGERIGRVARGFEADLLVLEDNPLQQIENTRLIHAIVLDGDYITSERLVLDVDFPARLALVTAAAVTTEALFWLIAAAFGLTVFEARQRIWRTIRDSPRRLLGPPRS